jgi:hypothetical protein
MEYVAFYGHLVYLINVWSILRPIGLFYAHLVYFRVIWHICPHFGMLYQEKSGNPGSFSLISGRKLSRQRYGKGPIGAENDGKSHFVSKSPQHGGQADQKGRNFACWAVVFFG